LRLGPVVLQGLLGREPAGRERRRGGVRKVSQLGKRRNTCGCCPTASILPETTRKAHPCNAAQWTSHVTQACASSPWSWRRCAAAAMSRRTSLRGCCSLSSGAAGRRGPPLCKPAVPLRSLQGTGGSQCTCGARSAARCSEERAEAMSCNAQLCKDASERPHVDGCVVGKAQDDFRAAIKAALRAS
jgi:hypothetical protein